MALEFNNLFFLMYFSEYEFYIEYIFWKKKLYSLEKHKPIEKLAWLLRRWKKIETFRILRKKNNM